MIYISPHWWWWFNPHSTIIILTSSHSRNVLVITGHHTTISTIGSNKVKLSPPFQPSDSMWRPLSTRTCPSPCGTWEARTRSAPCGATTTREPMGFSAAVVHEYGMGMGSKAGYLKAGWLVAVLSGCSRIWNSLLKSNFCVRQNGTLQWYWTSHIWIHIIISWYWKGTSWKGA